MITTQFSLLIMINNNSIGYNSIRMLTNLQGRRGWERLTRRRLSD